MAQRQLTIISPSGIVTIQVYDKRQQLEILQKAVGGYIEVVPYFTRYSGRVCTCYCNEEGKLDRLAPNAAATALWHEQLGPRAFDILAGHVAIDQTLPKGGI